MHKPTRLSYGEGRWRTGKQAIRAPGKRAFPRRTENQGLGIGAFIYYRRVVENQKNRILHKVIDVSEKIRADNDKILQLKSAVKETQFSKALEMAKDVIPESLLIYGHNPISLLHSALTRIMHKMKGVRPLL